MDGWMYGWTYGMDVWTHRMKMEMDMIRKLTDTLRGLSNVGVGSRLLGRAREKSS